MIFFIKCIFSNMEKALIDLEYFYTLIISATLTDWHVRMLQQMKILNCLSLVEGGWLIDHLCLHDANFTLNLLVLLLSLEICWGFASKPRHKMKIKLIVRWSMTWYEKKCSLCFITAFSDFEGLGRLNLSI